MTHGSHNVSEVPDEEKSQERHTSQHSIHQMKLMNISQNNNSQTTPEGDETKAKPKFIVPIETKQKKKIKVVPNPEQVEEEKQRFYHPPYRCPYHQERPERIDFEKINKHEAEFLSSLIRAEAERDEKRKKQVVLSN